jgi:hypothetical protein
MLSRLYSFLVVDKLPNSPAMRGMTGCGLLNSCFHFPPDRFVVRTCRVIGVVKRVCCRPGYQIIGGKN